MRDLRTGDVVFVQARVVSQRLDNNLVVEITDTYGNPMRLTMHPEKVEIPSEEDQIKFQNP